MVKPWLSFQSPLGFPQIWSLWGRMAWSSLAHGPRSPRMVISWPNGPEGPWTAGAWGISGLRLFTLVSPEQGSVQPRPGDVLATPKVYCHFFKALPVSRSLDRGTGEGLASSGCTGSTPRPSQAPGGREPRARLCPASFSCLSLYTLIPMSPPPNLCVSRGGRCQPECKTQNTKGPGLKPSAVSSLHVAWSFLCPGPRAPAFEHGE